MSNEIKFIYMLTFLHIIFVFFKKQKMSYITAILLFYSTKIINNIYIKNLFSFNKAKVLLISFVLGIIITYIITKLLSFELFELKIKSILINVFNNIGFNIYIVLEEILWRGIIQFNIFLFFNNYLDYFYSVVLTILLTSLFFVIGHKKQNLMKQIELFIFSIILGIVVYYTNNIYYGIGIHLGRNNYLLTFYKRRKFNVTKNIT